MKDKLNLGIVYNEDEKIVNHRSLIKVIFNPFLRLMGFQIATIYDIETNELCKPTIIRCKRRREINFKYELEENWKLEFKRIFI